MRELFLCEFDLTTGHLSRRLAHKLVMNFVMEPLGLIDQSIGKRVTLMTSTGYEFEGVLMGLDASANCVLTDVEERHPLDSEFEPKKHTSTLVNGATISIIIPAKRT